MEDEDDSYGFGSYAQLFDGDAVASADPAPALDAAAVRRFWMPEYLLRQLRPSPSGGETGFGTKEFQHVAARLDGCVVDGGLGRVSLAHPRDAAGGGVLWLQAAKSDSNAQQRRRRQLGVDARSPAALFVPLTDVESVTATAVQNTVQAVELALVGGHVLHLAFLPGPFFHANHRDEFLAMVNQRLEAQRGAGGARRTEGEASDADSARLESPRDGNKTPCQAEAEAMADTTRRDASLQVDVSKEAMRALVRRYSTLDALSDEAIQLARQVHEATGYHLGPLAKKFPRFSADATHRKQAVQQLSKFLTKMNDEWSRADAHRELHTNTRSFRNQDELFQYTDAATGEDVSPRSYESRYAQYAGLDDSDPIIRCVSSGEAASERVNAANSYKAKLSVLLGVDVSSSCVIDEAFFKDDPADGDSQQDSVPDMQSEAAAARQTLWQRWEAAFSDYMKQRDAITGGLGVNTATVTFQASSSGAAARKRPRDRRRSILAPSEVAGLDELVATNASSSESAPHDSEPSPSHGKRRRRSSSSSLEQPVDSTSARRKARRQSITGAVDTSVLASGESKEDAQKSAGTPAHPKRGQPSSLKASSNDGEARDENKEHQEELCQLCFSERADVEMDPCAHRVCGTCWERLGAGGGGTSDSCGQHMCPWDRELVSKR